MLSASKCPYNVVMYVCVSTCTNRYICLQAFLLVCNSELILIILTLFAMVIIHFTGHYRSRGCGEGIEISTAQPYLVEPGLLVDIKNAFLVDKKNSFLFANYY